MSILKKNKPPDNLDTLIGSKTIFEGVLMSNESICIEGTVKGKVECKGSVVVGRGGKVKADIIAENVLIGGQVNGHITAKNKLRLPLLGELRVTSKPPVCLSLKGSSLRDVAAWLLKKVLNPVLPSTQ
jgi:cytoskeletal protein CcmA (bactofilin family)